MDSFIFQITKCQGSTGRLVATKRLAGTKNDGNITYQLNPLHSKPKKKSNFNFRLNIRETETIRWNVKKKKRTWKKKVFGIPSTLLQEVRLSSTKKRQWQLSI
jgi:hypothetical protein